MLQHLQFGTSGQYWEWMLPYVYSKSVISEPSGKFIVKLSGATALEFYSSTIGF